MGLFGKSFDEKVEDAVAVINKSDLGVTGLKAKVDGKVVTLEGAAANLEAKGRAMLEFNKRLKTGQHHQQDPAPGRPGAHDAPPGPDRRLSAKSPSTRSRPDTLGAIAQRFYGKASLIEDLRGQHPEQPDLIGPPEAQYLHSLTSGCSGRSAWPRRLADADPPLVIYSLASRALHRSLSPLKRLGAPWATPWCSIVLGLRLLIEITVDKIPVVDTVNDVIQTVFRPVAGAVLFAASGNIVSNVSPVLAMICGLIIAGGVHTAKTGGRPAGGHGRHRGHGQSRGQPGRGCRLRSYSIVADRGPGPADAPAPPAVLLSSVQNKRKPGR